eukprot:TRINITY_DN3088_c0_g1_i11.p1 TRINITY_DN3088_c0_g1~~TRINITY_DN3088_c0_g1_i11.p1  ORF type:complete len:378 (+),score=-25.35 TRINITY_DN3088_c0_g1_i11:568-1701(+)
MQLFTKNILYIKQPKPTSAKDTANCPAIIILIRKLRAQGRNRIYFVITLKMPSNQMPQNPKIVSYTILSLLCVLKPLFLQYTHLKQYLYLPINYSQPPLNVSLEYHIHVKRRLLFSSDNHKHQKKGNNKSLVQSDATQLNCPEPRQRCRIAETPYFVKNACPNTIFNTRKSPLQYSILPYKVSGTGELISKNLASLFGSIRPYLVHIKAWRAQPKRKNKNCPKITSGQLEPFPSPSYSTKTHTYTDTIGNPRQNKKATRLLKTPQYKNYALFPFPSIICNIGVQYMLFAKRIFTKKYNKQPILCSTIDEIQIKCSFTKLNRSTTVFSRCQIQQLLGSQIGNYSSQTKSIENKQNFTCKVMFIYNISFRMLYFAFSCI